MGATCAPSIANLFMARYEERWFQVNPYQSHIKLWKRFIDDVFVLWEGTSQQFELFFNWLNTCDTNIQFTYESSRYEITYLDVRVVKGAGEWITTLYRKEIDRNTLLHFHSAHPPRLKTGLPFSQYLILKKLL